MSLRHFQTVLGGDLASKALAAVYTIAVVRWLSPAQLAELVHVSALVGLAVLTFNGIVNRHYIVSSPGPWAARSYRRWQAVASALAFVVVVGLLARDRDPLVLAAGLCSVVAAATFEFCRTFAQKDSRFARYAGADLLRSFIVLGFALPILLWDPVHAVALLLVTQAAAYALATTCLPKLPVPGPTEPRFALRTFMSDSSTWSLMTYFAFLALFGQLPILLLEHAGNEFALASFGSAMRYYGMAAALVVAAHVVVLPQLASVKEPLEVLRRVRRTLPMLLVAEALLAIVAIVGYFAIPLIDAGKYPDAPIQFVVLCCALAPGIFQAPFVSAFMHMRRFKALLASIVIACVCCAAVTLGLRQLGAISAAMAVPAGVSAQLIFLALALALGPRNRLAEADANHR